MEHIYITFVKTFNDVRRKIYFYSLTFIRTLLFQKYGIVFRKNGTGK